MNQLVFIEVEKLLGDIEYTQKELFFFSYWEICFLTEKCLASITSHIFTYMLNPLACNQYPDYLEDLLGIHSSVSDKTYLHGFYFNKSKCIIFLWYFLFGSHMFFLKVRNKAYLMTVIGHFYSEKIMS